MKEKESPPKQSGSVSYSLMSEQSVLGALIFTGGKGEKSIDALEMLKPSDFYNEAHRLVYQAMHSIIKARKPLDLVTLAEWMEDVENNLDSVGGFGYLAELTKNLPTEANLLEYARSVWEHSQARQLMKHASNVEKTLNVRDARTLSQRIESARTQMEKCVTSSSSAGLFNPTEILSAQMNDIDKKYGDVETVFNEAITHKDLALLTGAGGTGKSFFTIKLAISVALGRPAFSGVEKFLNPTKPGVVVFLIGEDDADIYRRRLDSILFSQQLNRQDKEQILSNVLFVSVAGMDTRVIRKSQYGDLEHTEIVTQISRSLKQANTKLAIFDPMNRFCGISENDNAEMNIFVSAMRRIADRASCAVLMVHHSAKGDAGGSRGASALVDGVRTHISLVTLEQMKSNLKGVTPDATDKNKILVRMVKSNHLPFWKKPYWLERRDGGDLFTCEAPITEEQKAMGRIHVDIQAVKSAVVEFLNEVGVPMEIKALTAELIQYAVKDICPEPKRLTGIIEDMLEQGLLKEINYGRAKKVTVNTMAAESSEPF